MTYDPSPHYENYISYSNVEKLKSQLSFMEKNKIKILYGLGLLLSIVNLIGFILNYKIISDNTRNLVGLIISSIQLLFSIFYLIFYNCKFILLKVTLALYGFFFPWNLIIISMINEESTLPSILIISCSFLLFNLLIGYLTCKSLLLQYPSIINR
jgi:hypothetical protein